MLEEMEESRFRGTLRNNRALDIAIFISLYSLVFSNTRYLKVYYVIKLGSTISVLKCL